MIWGFWSFWKHIVFKVGTSLRPLRQMLNCVVDAFLILLVFDHL
jgi:hypothetical protein